MESYATIENPMVMGSFWEHLERESGALEEIREKLNGPGYSALDSDIFIPEEKAFDYALEQCMEFVSGDIGKIKRKQEFKEFLVEWFYSGNWIKED